MNAAIETTSRIPVSLDKWRALGDDFRTFGVSQTPVDIPNF